MITSDLLSDSKAENDVYIVITESPCSIILNDPRPPSTNLVDMFHGVLV